MAISSLGIAGEDFVQSQAALSRWDNEGGSAPPVEAYAGVPELTNAELVHLRIRVIALENLIITLLAEGPDRQPNGCQRNGKLYLPTSRFYPTPADDQSGGSNDRHG